MSGHQVIYDALTMPIVDPGMVGVGLFVVLAFSAAAAVSWFQLRQKRGGRSSEDRSKEMMALGITTLVVLGNVGFITYSGVQTVLWRYEYTHHQYALLDGCVAQFSEQVQSDHDLGVDDFTLQGHPFRLSDSGWRVGYHLSHHHGSPISDGVHLRAFAQGPRLLRIELLATPCPGPG